MAFPHSLQHDMSLSHRDLQALAGQLLIWFLLSQEQNSQELLNMTFVLEKLSHLNSKVNEKNSQEMIKLTFVFTYILGLKPFFNNVNIVNIDGV